MDTSDTLSLNAMLDLLCHHYRRELIRFLRESPTHTATIDDLVAHLSPRAATHPSHRSRHDQLELAIQHVHLPQLTAAGLVEYDARLAVARYRGHDRVEALLDQLAPFEAE